MPTPSIPKRYTIIVIVVLTLIVAFLVKTQEKSELVLQPKPPIQVQVFLAMEQVIRVTAPITGRLQPARVAKLSFELAGKINTKKIKPGQSVKQGDTLLMLDSYDVDDNLVDAKSQIKLEYTEIAKDRVLLKLAKQHSALQAAEVERLVRLKKSAMASRTSVDEAKQKLISLEKDQALLQQKSDTAAQRISLKQSAVSRAQRNAERTQLIAPYDGVVNIIHADVGDYVTANTVAVELIDISALDLRIEVSQMVASQLKVGQPVEVHVLGETLQGYLYSLQMAAKEDTHTYPVKIRIPGAKFLPGSVAKVELLLQEREMLVVPPGAVQSRFGDHFVFTYGDGKVHRQEVQLGIRQGAWQEIVLGLKAGEQVISGNLDRLSDNQRAVLQTSAIEAH